MGPLSRRSLLADSRHLLCDTVVPLLFLLPLQAQLTLLKRLRIHLNVSAEQHKVWFDDLKAAQARGEAAYR